MKVSAETPLIVRWPSTLRYTAEAGRPDSPQVRKAKFLAAIAPSVEEAVASFKALDGANVRLMFYKRLRAVSEGKVVQLRAIQVGVCEGNDLHVYEGHEDEQSGTSHVDNDYVVANGCCDCGDDDDEYDYA